MINSITINGEKIVKNTLNISGGDLSVTSGDYDNSIKIALGTVTDDTPDAVEPTIVLPDNCPYITSLAGIKPDAWGTVWLLGGLTSQVDDSGNGFTLCDMSQTVDIPRIYRSIYSMLRQIRLWLDGHKDSLLLSKDDADKQWSTMLNDSDDWNPSDSSTDQSSAIVYKESRQRSDIPAIGSASNLLNEYFGIVALWNHLANSMTKSVSVRLHPADQSGVYIGINVIIPVIEKKDIPVKITVDLKLSGQTGDNLYTWLRTPVMRIIPDTRTTSSDSSNSMRSAILTCSLDNLEHVVSNPPSVLDDGFNVQGTSHTITISGTIPSDEIQTTHVLQCVVEAIPFFLCSETEHTYAEAKKADRSYERGENTWTIDVSAECNGKEIHKEQYIKKSIFANVCPEDSASSTSESMSTIL